MLSEVAAANGGFATKRQLVAVGATDRMLTWAVRSDELVRVRNGWYTIRPEADPAVRAIRVGGRLTGISALVEHGAWAWRRPRRLHVAVRANAARLRRQRDRRRRLRPRADAGLRVHWSGRDDIAPGTAWAVSIPDALVRVALDEPLEDAVIAFDWALRSGRIDRIDLERVLLELPLELRMLGDLADHRSDSILESASRLRLRRAGYAARPQVQVDGLASPVDLMVAGIVALETDGVESHLGRFEEDRRKDLVLTAAGHHAIRATSRQVREDWPSVLRAVTAALTARLGPEQVAALRAADVGNSGLPRDRRRIRAPRRGRRARPS